MDEPGATSSMAVKNLRYRHGHSGPEGRGEEARRNSLTWPEELKLKKDGRRGELTRSSPPTVRKQCKRKQNKVITYSNPT